MISSKISKQIQSQEKTADLGILDFVEKNGGMVATMDRELKSKIKHVGGSVLSIHNDKIVLEN